MTRGEVLADQKDRSRAIDLPRGGASIVAGAGTGKTHTLVHRLLLRVAAGHEDCRKDSCARRRPFLEQVLVTTFTERAAMEMRLRLGGTLRLLAALGAGALERGRMPDAGGKLARLAARPACLRGEIRALEPAAIGTFHALAFRAIRSSRAARGGSLTAILETDAERQLAAVLASHFEDPNLPRGLLRVLRAVPDAFADTRLRAMVREALRLASHPVHGAASPPALTRRILLASREAARATFEQAAARLQETRVGIAEALEGGTSGRKALEHLERWIAAAHRGAAAAEASYPLEAATRTALLEAIDDPKSGLSLGDTKNPDRDLRLRRWRRPSAALRQWLRGAVLLGHDIGEDGIREVVSWVVHLGAQARARARQAERIGYEDLLLEFRDNLLSASAGTSSPWGFREVLVDEAQDMDPVQGDLVAILAADKVPGAAGTRIDPIEPAGRTVLAVGDEKQCIYTWRSADLEHYRRFRERLGTVREPIRLVTNFRSRPHVLAAVNALFENAFAETSGEQRAWMLPGDEDFVAATTAQSLHPAREEAAGEVRSRVCYLHLPAKEDEPGWTALQDAGLPVHRTKHTHNLSDGARGDLEIRAVLSRIRELRASGAAWRDQVILYRANTGGLVTRLVRELSRAGIPHHWIGARGLLEIPEVRELHHVLRAAVLGSAEPGALWAALHAAWFPAAARAVAGMTPRALARRLRARERSRERGPGGEAERLREQGREREEEHAAPRGEGHEEESRSGTSSDAIDHALEVVLQTARDLSKTSLAATGRRVLDRIEARARLREAFEDAPETVRHVEVNLEAFLARIAALENEGLDPAAVLDRIRMAPREESQSAQALSESADVVRVQTVFSAKGLEFPHVMLLGTSSRPSGGGGLEAPVAFEEGLPVPLVCLETFRDPATEHEKRRARRKGGSGDAGGDAPPAALEKPRLAPGPLAVRHRVRGDQRRWNEAMRLLYVGMTRARESFFLCVPWRKGDRADAWGRRTWARLLTRFHDALEKVRMDPPLVEAIDTAQPKGVQRIRDLLAPAAATTLDPRPSPSSSTRLVRPPEPGLVDPSLPPPSLEALEPLSVTSLLHPREEASPHRGTPPGDPPPPHPRGEKGEAPLERDVAGRLGTLLHRLFERHPGDPKGFAVEWTRLRRDPRFLGILRREVAGNEDARLGEILSRGDGVAAALPRRLASLVDEDPRDLTWHPELPLAGRLTAGEIAAATRDAAITRDPSPELRAVLSRAQEDPGARIAVHGVADLVALDEKGTRAWILDYKTGHVGLSGPERVRAEAQLTLYRDLLLVLRPGLDVHTGILAPDAT